MSYFHLRHSAVTIGRVPHSSAVLARVGMFPPYRLSPTRKLDCPHAMGTNAFPPEIPRLRSGFRQRALTPLNASTFRRHARSTIAQQSRFCRRPRSSNSTSAPSGDH